MKEKKRKLVFFNLLGNVEALGIRAGEAFLMSQKHTLTNKRERERILETGKRKIFFLLKKIF